MEKPVKWATLASAYLEKNPYLSLRRDTRTAPGFGPHDFFILEFHDWVNVVAVTEEGQAVLVRQFRQGLAEVTLEIPGGVVDPGEEPGQAVRRELLEETGYAPREIRLLTAVRVNPAIQGNRCHLFLALGCQLKGAQALEGTESIRVELVPLDALAGLMARGEIDHSLNCLALHLALQYLGK